QVGHVAGGKQQRAWAPGELGQRLLQLVVRGAVADHQVRGAATDAPSFRAVAQGGDHLGMVGQTQVVVGAEGQQRLAVDLYIRALRAGQQRALAEQIGSL